MVKRHAASIALAIALAAGIWSASPSAMAQTEPRGPGMLYGPGYGRGMMGPAYGPGMMFGYGRRDVGYGPGMMGSCGMGGGPDGQTSSFAQGRIAFLKAELNLTDSQSTQWDAFAKALKNNLQNMQGIWQSMRAALEVDAPVERLDAHVAVLESRLAALKEIKPALSDFYNALNAEQKKKADELLPGVGCMM
jgi:hypothetical protein